MTPIGFLFGVVFGFLIGWARVTDYDVIHDMLLLREPYVFLIMMSAVITAATGARLLRWLQMTAVIDGAPVEWKTDHPARHHVIGSVLFGLGWSLASTCPGPVAAQIGRGQLVGLFTVGGILAGVALRDWVHAHREAIAERFMSRDVDAVGL